VSAFPTTLLLGKPKIVKKRAEALPLFCLTVSFNDYKNEDGILAAVMC